MDAAPRILIVDDNPAIHQDFRKILESTGKRNHALEAVEAVIFDAAVTPESETRFSLDFASQGQEALAKVTDALATGRPYSLAFVDIRMPPGWDGIETVAQIWAVDPAVQIVICTAYSDYSWEKMTQRLGLNDNLVILKKPFDNIEVQQLAHALTKKWLVTLRAQLRMEQLDAMVAERTADLRRSEERFATAFQASPLAMAIQSLNDDRFVDVNAAFLSLANCRREEIVGLTPLECRLLIDYDEGAVGPRLGASASLSFRASDPRDVRVSNARIMLAGEPHVLLLIEDVSERLRLEAQLRQSQKMEAVGQLAAGVAHDFNNLLTIIEGHASLQLETGLLPQDSIEAMLEIQHAAERAAALTRQLLAFSRQQIIRPRVLDLNGVVRGLQGMLGRILGERVEIRYELDSALPTICADQTSVEQVIMNLMLNARDAMPSGGRITLTTSSRPWDAIEAEGFTHIRPGTFACLSVSDTGIGMDPATRAHIFEPFFTTKEVNKGTGMGLATVYGIVRQHEAWIQVATALGEGSRFDVHFPVSGQAAEYQAPQSEGLSRGSQQTIFIVEDDSSVRSLVREMLEHFEYRIIEAESGDHALQIWPSIKDQVQLLLTDMVMPGDHNGLQLAQKLLADKPELKVIYSSGYSVDLFSTDIDLIDGENYLPKPYLISKLVAIVRKAFE